MEDRLDELNQAMPSMTISCAAHTNQIMKPQTRTNDSGMPVQTTRDIGINLAAAKGLAQNRPEACWAKPEYRSCHVAASCAAALALRFRTVSRGFRASLVAALS